MGDLQLPKLNKHIQYSVISGFFKAFLPPKMSPYLLGSFFFCRTNLLGLLRGGVQGDGVTGEP